MPKLKKLTFLRKKELTDRFQEVLNRRRAVGIPNIVWVAILTSLDVTISSKKDHSIKAYFIKDLGTGEIVGSKLFVTRSTSNTSKANFYSETISPSLIVNFTESIITKKNIQEPLFLHSDKTAEFISKTWKKSFKKNPMIKGSWFLPHAPTASSLMEPFLEAFKYPVGHFPSISRVYDSLESLNEDFQKKVQGFNRLYAFTSPLKILNILKPNRFPLYPFYSINAPYKEGGVPTGIEISTILDLLAQARKKGKIAIIRHAVLKDFKILYSDDEYGKYLLN